MKVPDNSNVVIFGASGDLNFRKLVPALYHLFSTDQLPARFFILGVSRSAFTDTEFRQAISSQMLKIEGMDSQRLSEFMEHLYYLSINTADEHDYGRLKERLLALYEQYQAPHNTLYYLATPPSLFGVIPRCLAAHELNKEAEGWKRLIVEKPIGLSLIHI